MRSLIKAIHSSTMVKITMDFSNFWKHCYRFAPAFFHTV